MAEGEAIEQGDVLGMGGETGDADGKHLHFELYQDEQLVDPLRYLPADQQATSGSERISCAQGTIRLDPASELSLRILPQSLSGYEIQTVAYTGISVAARNLGITATKRAPLSPKYACRNWRRRTARRWRPASTSSCRAPGSRSTS